MVRTALATDIPTPPPAPRVLDAAAAVEYMVTIYRQELIVSALARQHRAALIDIIDAGDDVTLAKVGSLTDSTGGTPTDTLVTIAGSGDDADINNNFADLVRKVNSVITQQDLIIDLLTAIVAGVDARLSEDITIEGL